MKKLLIVLIIMVSVLGLTACNNTVSSDKMLARNWPDGTVSNSETFTYSVTKGDDTVGQMTQKIEYADGGFVLTTAQSYNREGGTDTINSVVKFQNSQGFYPTESTVTSVINDVTKTVKVVYSSSKISVYKANAAVIPEETAAASFEIAAPYYDNKQFFAVIRGGSYDSKFSLAFNTYVPDENAVVKLSTSLGSTSSFTVLGQTVATQSINVSRSAKIAGNPIIAHYATGNVTVGEGLAAKTVVHALVKIIEGSYVYTLTNITVD